MRIIEVTRWEDNIKMHLWRQCTMVRYLPMPNEHHHSVCLTDIISKCLKFIWKRLRYATETTVFIDQERAFTCDMSVKNSMWSKHQHKQSVYHSVMLNNNNGCWMNERHFQHQPWVDYLGNVGASDRLCGLEVTIPGYRPKSTGFDSRRYQIFRVAEGLERGTLSPCEDKWGAIWKKK
jgi:hypothetical protein